MKDIEDYNRVIDEARAGLEKFFSGREEREIIGEILDELKEEGTNRIYYDLYDFTTAKKAIKAIMGKVSKALGIYARLAETGRTVIEAKDRGIEEERARLREERLEFSRDAVRTFRLYLGLRPGFDFVESLQRNLFADGRDPWVQGDVRDFQRIAIMYSVIEHRGEKGQLRSIEGFLKSGEADLLVKLAGTSPGGYVIPPAEEKEEPDVEEERELQPDEKDSSIIGYIGSNGRATLKEILNHTGMPKTTLFRRLNGLVERGTLKVVKGKDRFDPDVYSLA